MEFLSWHCGESLPIIHGVQATAALEFQPLGGVWKLMHEHVVSATQPLPGVGTYLCRNYPLILVPGSLLEDTRIVGGSISAYTIRVRERRNSTSRWSLSSSHLTSSNMTNRPPGPHRSSLSLIQREATLRCVCSQSVIKNNICQAAQLKASAKLQ